MSSISDPRTKRKGKACPCKRIPLHLSSFTAAEHGDLPALHLRLSKRPQQHQQQPAYDSAGNTPLHFAAQHGHTDSVALLLGTGEYDNMYNNAVHNTDNDIYKVSGVTPLHRACFSGATSSVRLLLDHIITIVNKNRNKSRNHSISSILSLPDTSFNDYQTPLHKCASGGRYLVVQLLLDFIFQYDNDGRISDHDAQSSTIVELLLMAQDAIGRTPLDVAREKQQQQNLERQSVQRWDTIAGGCADWDICVQVSL
jgi:Ankyrin repeats (3 copies)